MPLEITQPWSLLGLLALPVLGWYFYRGLTDFSRWQRVTSLVARTAVVLLGRLLSEFPEDGPSLVLNARVLEAHLSGRDYDPIWELPGK